MPALARLLADLAEKLQGVSETPLLDAQVLAAHILGRGRSWVLAHPEYTLSPAQAEQFARHSQRLQAGEPLPYLLGSWEFYGLTFHLTPDVLIPRPETELLVEQALDWLRSTRQPDNAQPILAADIGSGSGCIAVSLAVHFQTLRVVASDLSMAALRVAKENVLQNGVAARVYPLQADLLPALRQSLDLLCANLPYIPDGTLRSLDVAAWEPKLALYGGQDGLALVHRLLDGIISRPGCLSPHSLVLLEIEASQGAAALALAKNAFPGADVRLLQDLAGHDRLLRIEQAL